MKKNIFLVLLFVLFSSFVFAEDIILQNGNLKMILHEYSGSVSLYGKSNKNGKFISLIDNSNYSVNSGFYLDIDGITRKLERTYDINVVTNSSDYGLSVIFEIKNQAEVEIIFSTFASSTSSSADSVKVVASVKNLSDEIHEYSLKAVFDTLLGEATNNHFFTATINPVKAVTTIDSMANHKYVASSNGYDTVAFLLAGQTISSPEKVFLASRDNLLKTQWIENTKDGSVFDSINTYNNSALGILWRTVELAPFSKSSFAFYIVTSTNKKAFPLEKSFPSTILELNNPEDVNTSTYVDSYGVTYTVGTYSDAQLDPEYIANLLNRVHSLEIESDGSNRDEIKKLNAELEAILKKIKRLNPEENGTN